MVLFVVATLLASSLNLVVAVGSTPPNFVIVLSDDQGFGDTGYECRANPKQTGHCPMTPNLDAMASGPHSVYFHRFYSTPVCSPTRASLLTGRSNLRSCMGSVLPCDHMTDPTWKCMQSTNPLPHAEFTIAEAVRKSGLNYSTIQLGKWHLGDLFDKKKTGWKGSGRSKFWPVSSPGDAGFETWHATQSQTVVSTPNCGCFPAPPGWTPLPGGLPPQVKNSTSGCAKFGFRPGSNCVVGGGLYVNYSNPCQNYWSPDATSPIGVTNLTLKSPEQIPADDNEYIMDRFEAFAKGSKAAARPFLAYLPIHSIHLPHPALPKFYAMYPADSDPDYVGTLTQMDVQIGRLRQFLKDEELADNTLLWFTSDNGPHCEGAFQNMCGGVGTGRSTAGLRGCKASHWEGGIRVPGIVEWPQGIAKHVDAPIPGTAYDILPTIMDILGVDHEHPDWPLDGQSLLPLFSDKMISRHPFGIGLGFGHHERSAAWIDGDMKFATGLTPGQGCSYEAPYTQATSAGPFLYNLSSDPTESVDMKHSQPELYQQMLAAYNAWTSSVSASTENENKCEKQHGASPSPPPTPPTPTPPSSSCRFTVGVGGCGGDKKKVSVADRFACCGECLKDPECSVAVFEESGFCHMKTLTKPCYAKKGYSLCNITGRIRSSAMAFV